jgi:hypothetical protein
MADSPTRGEEAEEVAEDWSFPRQEDRKRSEQPVGKYGRNRTFNGVRAGNSVDSGITLLSTIASYLGSQLIIGLSLMVGDGGGGWNLEVMGIDVDLGAWAVGYMVLTLQAVTTPADVGVGWSCRLRAAFPPGSSTPAPPALLLTYLGS